MTSKEKPANTPIKLLWLTPVTTSKYNEIFANMIKLVKRDNVQVVLKNIQ